MRVVQVFIVGVCALSLGSAAIAATLQPNGSVLVNKGQGFRSASASQTVEAGDTIMVNKGSTAQIVFGGCTMNLPVTGTYVVPTEAQCLSLLNNAGGAAGGAAGAAAGGTVFGVAPATAALTALTVGGLVAGGIYVARELAASN